MQRFTLFPMLFLTPVLMFMSIAMPASALTEAVDSPWSVAANPYRLRLKLDRSISGPTAIELDPQSVIERVAKASVDQMNQETFAFEKALLVNPLTGKTVGRFQLVRLDQPFDIDGSFINLSQGKSPWKGFLPGMMAIKPVELGGVARQALVIKEERVLNAKVQQTVQLAIGQRYLLEYWFMMDTQDNAMSVMLNDPSRTLFAQLPHSYYNKMPPRGEWAHRRVIFRPRIERAQREVRPEPMDVSLVVSHALIGHGGVADIRFQPVAWRLIVDPHEPTDVLDLYAMARAGHRLTVPTDELLASDPPGNQVTAELGEAEIQPLNFGATVVANGKTTAWTLDPVLPLKVGLIRGYQPIKSQAAAAARVDAFRGGSSSLVIAVDAGTPRLDDLEVRSDLPAEVRFHRLATVPVYDGPTVNGQVKGRLLETRYEPMVPLDFALDPDSTDGVHLLLATITPGDDTPNGTQHGTINLRFNRQELDVPVQLNIAPMTLAPKRHFGTLFGAISFLVGYEKGVAGMVEDTTTVAAFHGLDDKGLSPKTVMSLSIPDMPDTRTREVRTLAERYFHVMLDHHLLPQSPAIYAYFSYNVVERGEGLAPELTGWDFSHGYDEAIKEFVIGRDMPWLMVGRTNGHLINRITLNNGKTYSIDSNPDDQNWVELSREEFDRLVGDYWNHFAAHLEDLGVLDRALFVIDESSSKTYANIYAYVMAMKSHPCASQIKIGHTTYNTSTWTHRLPSGKLLMDEVLDVPMPINDEHFNFFEPEWYSRFKRPGKVSWVYNVESDHITLQNTGLSTLFVPLKLRHFGVQGWYDWECFTWSMPYGYREGAMGGFEYVLGPAINPWVNPFYHHGPGVLSFFYPPDPRGPASEPTDLVIPSYRLTLLRDGIQERALLSALQTGRDDVGSVLKANAQRLGRVEINLAALWSDNPVQWHLDYTHYREARRLLFDLAMESATP